VFEFEIHPISSVSDERSFSISFAHHIDSRSTKQKAFSHKKRQKKNHWPKHTFAGNIARYELARCYSQSFSCEVLRCGDRAMFDGRLGRDGSSTFKAAESSVSLLYLALNHCCCSRKPRINLTELYRSLGTIHR
jgi:hypothetical protein